MNTSLRRNACPSLAAPMRTGDGLLVRINTVTGAIWPSHLALIAEAAARHGNGILEVTRRGSLQVRGLTAESAALFSQEVLDSGIEVRSGVPVETGPLAGLDPTEIDDARRLVLQLIDRIEKTDLPGRFGPKVSVVIDGGGQLSMGDVLADVRLTAVAESGGVRWQIALGGTAETARVVGVADDEIAIELALELLKAIAARGHSGRGKDLSEQEISGACSTLLKTPAKHQGTTNSSLSVSAPPRHLSPTSVGERMGAKVAAGQPLPHIRGTEVSSPKGETERGISARHAGPGGTADIGGEAGGRFARRPLGSPELPIGIFSLKQRPVALGLGLPFGQVRADQLSALAQAAENAEISEFRLAPGHALLTICDTAVQAENIEREATSLGFIVDPRDARLRIVACAGAPACSSGLIQTKDVAARIAGTGLLRERDVLPDNGLLPETGLVHVSGCAKRCAEPASAAFTILGTPDGASILEGKDGPELARVGETELARVAEGKITAAFQRVLASRGVGRDTKPAPKVRHRKSA